MTSRLQIRLEEHFVEAEVKLVSKKHLWSKDPAQSQSKPPSHLFDQLKSFVQSSSCYLSPAKRENSSESLKKEKKNFPLFRPIPIHKHTCFAKPITDERIESRWHWKPFPHESTVTIAESVGKFRRIDTGWRHCVVRHSSTFNSNIRP